MYRITQEALTNARKHGRATSATVRIVEDAESVLVSVRDDGQGFDPGATTDGFGIAGMRERAELAGGRLTIDSAPGAGTTVEARLPVRRRGVGQVARPAVAPDSAAAR